MNLFKKKLPYKLPDNHKIPDVCVQDYQYQSVEIYGGQYYGETWTYHTSSGIVHETITFKRNK